MHVWEKLTSFLHSLGWSHEEIGDPQRLRIRRSGVQLLFSTRQLSLDSNPIVMLAHLGRRTLPAYRDLYQKYLDTSFSARALIENLSGELAIPYLMLFDTKLRTYFYDVPREEILFYADQEKEFAEKILPHLDQKLVSTGALERVPRKSPERHGRELAEWVNLWSAELGSKTEASRRLMRLWFQKVILLKYYELVLGGVGQKRTTLQFLRDPGRLRQKTRHLLSPITFLHRKLDSLYARYHMPFFNLTHDERRLLRRLDRLRSKSYLLFSEINQIATAKFSLDSFLFAFGDERLLHQSWKTDFTTRAIKLSEALIQSDAVIYEPYVVQLEEVGYGWMLRVFEEIVEHWRSHNRRIREAQSLGRFPTLQPDIFQPLHPSVAPDGTISDVINFTLSSAFRVRVQNADQAETALFLLCAKILSLSKQFKIPLKPLDNIESVFIA
jgi:hypothetical protein